MRLGLDVRGEVQGVGFRPFVHRMAVGQGLFGWVRNARDGVRIEVQGGERAIARFLEALERDLPAPARIDALEREPLVEGLETSFAIAESDVGGTAAPVLPADLVTCGACLADVQDPSSRYAGYPLTSCSRCGPRYAIATGLPYDRANTTMSGFRMCEACRAEYDDPGDRRHHAQPIACPACGPQVELVEGHATVPGAEALALAIAAIDRGEVVALRGVGGFQLIVDAESEAAVARLRKRKHRPRRPFAVMFADADAVARCCRLTEAERALLEAPSGPIVLLERGDGALAPSVAPDSPWLGAMLPTTALHHLLLRGVGRPCVCTSGNLSREPMAIDLDEARAKLEGVADVWLTHHRPIARPLDDPLMRVVEDDAQVLRRGRGFAPLPVAALAGAGDAVACGAHLKASVAVLARGRVILGPHVGDLDAPATRDRLRESAMDLTRFFDVRPARIACDLHPDYASTRLAEALAAELDAPLVRVQHHHAHVAAVMAEHGLEGEVLGLSWDGTGFGADGTVWGGEALVCRGATFERAGHLAPFALPGGDHAAREPWRSALGWLLANGEAPAALGGGRPRDEVERLAAAVSRGINAPVCTSMGRLFDAVAALLGVIDTCSYEGQAAMRLEALAMKAPSVAGYAMPLVERGGAAVANTGVLLAQLLADRAAGRDVAEMARAFHEAVIDLGAAWAHHAGVGSVVLSGGCFQNRILHEGLSRRLSDAGFSVYTGHAVPPNDGGIAVGQLLVAARQN